MKSRRTASADIPLQPSSDPISDSTHRTRNAALIQTSASCPERSAVGSAYSLSTLASSPARLQGVREDPRHRSLPTPTSQKVTRSSLLQRHQHRHRRRSSPEVDNATTLPYRSHMRVRGRDDCLRTASLDPPITKDSLSELDLNRIVNDSRLRHDINFEHEIMFRPNTYGSRGAQKKREDNEYFEALALEFEYYIKRQRSLSPSGSRSAPDSPTSLYLRTPLPVFPQRLPPMITAIREVIKTLVPTAKWQTVDGQFDVDLRMQELEHGICDIVGLFEWVGKLLLCSCSPMRDPVVNTMVARSQQAVITQDAHELVSSIRDLFGVLETMKLDVANHQIRYLRLYLLEESIQFAQTQILDQIDAGWSISHERRWFEINYAHPEREDRFLMFKESVVDRIVTFAAGFPITLAGDHERLKQLQHDFRLCHYHAACGYTFTYTLQKLGWRGPPPPTIYTECMKRIGAIVGALGLDFNFEAHPDVVLEIVREAFKVCNITALPDHSTIRSTQLYFQRALDRRSPFYSEVESMLWGELSTRVHSEANAIFDMTPLEILNRYDPGPPGSSMNNNRGGDLSLESISKRAAHIIVLHWRIWAPIFHNLPGPDSLAAQDARTITEEEEMAERGPRHVSVSAVNSSQPVVVQGQGRHRAHSARMSRRRNGSRSAVYTPKSSDDKGAADEGVARPRGPERD